MKSIWRSIGFHEWNHSVDKDFGGCAHPYTRKEDIKIQQTASDNENRTFWNQQGSGLISGVFEFPLKIKDGEYQII